MTVEGKKNERLEMNFEVPNVGKERSNLTQFKDMITQLKIAELSYYLIGLFLPRKTSTTTIFNNNFPLPRACF